MLHPNGVSQNAVLYQACEQVVYALFNGHRSADGLGPALPGVHNVHAQNLVAIQPFAMCSNPAQPVEIMTVIPVIMSAAHKHCIVRAHYDKASLKSCNLLGQETLGLTR